MPDTPEQRVSDERLHDLVNVNDYEALQSHARPLAFDLFDARARIAELEAEVATARDSMRRQGFSCADEDTLVGWIRNVLQAWLTEKGNADRFEKDRDALREKLAKLEESK